MPRVIVGCEFSGTVRDAFAQKGWDAWSCDVLPSTRPGNHHQGDILEFLNATAGSWDLGIFHPPCTYLANSGVQHLHKEHGRHACMLHGAWFFRELYNTEIPHICVENPIPHGYAVREIGAKYTQIIHPYQFGHKEKKATCLWLKNLPKLTPVTDLKAETDALPIKEQQRMFYMSPGKDRGMKRSITYQGFADAMADQWSTITGEA